MFGLSKNFFVKNFVKPDASLTLVLLGIGLFFTAWFFVYEVTSTKFTREMPKELLISVVASIFMGLGSHFLILWVGIYV